MGRQPSSEVQRRYCATEKGKATRKRATEKWQKIAKEKYRTDPTYRAKKIRSSQNTSLKIKYGLTLADVQERFAAQSGLCALCGEPMNDYGGRARSAAVVDHDHITGRVRGIIHGSCNTALGAFGDNVEGLEKALKYLRSAA